MILSNFILDIYESMTHVFISNSFLKHMSSHQRCHTHLSHRADPKQVLVVSMRRASKNFSFQLMLSFELFYIYNSLGAHKYFYPGPVLLSYGVKTKLYHINHIIKVSKFTKSIFSLYDNRYHIFAL